MKILCICPIGIGNYLLCYPSWKLLKKEMPEAELHLLALRKSILELASGDAIWSKVYLIEPTQKSWIKNIFPLLKKLCTEKYDVSLSFFPSNTWQYNLFPFIIGVKERIAFNYHLKNIFTLYWLNTKLFPVDIMLHDVEQNIEFVKKFLNREVKNFNVVFPDIISGFSNAKAEKFLGSSNRRFVAVHPGSSVEHGMGAKRWPPERFGKLADYICKELKATALILGGPDETKLKRDVASIMECDYMIIEPQPLDVTAALVKRCLVCLCNDSGIMHLAACNNVPTIAIFGPTDEKRNGPYGDKHCIVRKEVDGFPIWTAANVGVRRVPKGIDPNYPLLALDVEEAWNKIRPFLKNICTENYKKS
ncbi:MAG: glycosyltransferase family 9 protein [Chitinispirillaceae bacterium]|nr:glycosyltransferase family 9 protein [Chitinispirillaceae bacterium]